jgi:hypothetical protein
MILNGLDSTTEDRFLQSLEYLGDLITEWEKVFRRASDVPLSLSPSTPVNITPNVSMTANNPNTRPEYMQQQQNLPDHSISLPYACHEIFFKVSRLLNNSNVVYKAMRIIYSILPFMALHIDVIIESIHPDPSSFIVDEMCMDYIRVLVPAIENCPGAVGMVVDGADVSGDVGGHGRGASEMDYQREKLVTLVCDCVVHFRGTAKVNIF